MLEKFDFPEGFRAGTELRGINLGASRQPLTEQQRRDRLDLQDRLQKAFQQFALGSAVRS